MVVGCRKNIDIAFDKTDRGIASLSIPALANTLLSIILALHKDGAAIIMLMEGNTHWPVKQEEFRAVAIKRIAQTLMLAGYELPLSLL